MKKILIIGLAIIPFLQSSTCKKNTYKYADAVKLKATLSDTSETINLGDTMKVTLTIPDILVTETGQNTFVSSLQKGEFVIACNRIDTINRWAVSLNNTNGFFVSEGTNVGGTVSIRNISRPYRVVVNFIPPQRGYYYIEILPQPGKLNVNNDLNYGLKVDFNVINKHWNTLAYYYNVYFNTNISEFLSQNQYLENEGYGFYGFRVN
jgi:hypothetical protein